MYGWPKKVGTKATSTRRAIVRSPRMYRKPSVRLYRGLAGICVDGCVRDTDEIAALPLPVFARSAGIRPYSTELELVAVNVPVAFAGMQVRPGDIVVGDGAGLLAIPAEQAGAVLLQILDIAGLEQEMEAAIKRQAPIEEIERLGKRKKISKAE